MAQDKQLNWKALLGAEAEAKGVEKLASSRKLAAQRLSGKEASSDRVLAVGAPLGLSGCWALSMGFATPIPIPPWVTERMEEKYAYPNDFRTPILAPLRDGFPPPLCEDPPDEARILRALPRASSVPYLCEEHRDNIRTVTELLVDKINEPRFFPLIGPAQLHHCHWKCTVYYDETIECGYPFPFRVVRPRAQVVYMDLDHLHLYAGKSPEAKKGSSSP